MPDRYTRHSGWVVRSRRWQALRLEVLRRDGFKCRSCGAAGRLEVDHVVPVRTAPERAFDHTNLQALCGACHASKTRQEVGLGPADPNRAKWRRAVMEIMNDAR